MRFLYPLGFLGLIAIPFIILIYIIKNRYTEKVIASTYIWNMSEKFLKRRVPISKLVGIISLILQLLAVVFISFAIARPVIIVPGAAHSYCFVLDASGSMNFEQNGQTRFEIAQKRIADMIDDSANGSDYTIICSGSYSQIACDRSRDKKIAKQRLNDLSVGSDSLDAESALATAQWYFDENPSVLTYFLTDKDYLETSNINIIDVSEDAENYAVTNIEYELSGSQLKVTGTVISYSGEKSRTVQLYFDDSDEVYDSLQVTATRTGTDFEFLCDKTNFGFFKVTLAEKDALALDNEVVVYDVAYQNISDILLVSDSPFFLRASLAAAGITKLDFVKTDEYTGDTGYGLYIFDSFMPETLPDDGAVWFINPKNTLAGTNFSFQGEVEARSSAKYSTSTETAVRTLLSGVVDPADKSAKTFGLKSYDKCRVNGKFYELAYCDNNPILFVGSNVYGNREAVFCFDVHDSADFVLSGALSILVKNLIDYSFPTVINDTTYFCGDTIQINIIAACNTVRIETPTGNVTYLDTSVAISEYRLSEVGVYNIVLVMKDKTERVVNVFAELQEEERAPLALGEEFFITGTAENGRSDGSWETLLYIFIILAVLAVADYGLYCYEQYQLR